MVTTGRQIIEKMLGRRLTDKEFGWMEKTSHHEMLRWAQATAQKEGRAPGYPEWKYREMMRK